MGEEKCSKRIGKTQKVSFSKDLIASNQNEGFMIHQINWIELLVKVHCTGTSYCIGTFLVGMAWYAFYTNTVFSHAHACTASNGSAHILNWTLVSYH